ncbi:MAG: VCBS repeat-containing protein [Saprospiraceae bacterium]|nr:VCBS repeat-containing protein [Saprospiraceae bacterium]
MYTKYILFSFFMALLWSACSSDTEQETTETTAQSAVLTERKADATGIDFSNKLQSTARLNILEYLYYYNGGGVAVGDINNDGLEDVLLTANESADKLYLNKGNLQFEDITEKSGLEAMTNWSSGAVMDDINGDGLMDIYICKVAPVSEMESHNLLYINNGDQTFTESAKEYGLDFSGYATHASFFDYDRDGDLDVYLLNHSVHSVRSYGKTSKRQQKDELSGDRLLENRMNEAEAKFVDVTEAAGIYSSALGYGLGLVTTDINNDGWVDIYVGNDFHENDYIYLNNGDKTFTESMAKMLGHSSKFTMSVDIADMNQDGRPDIFTTDMLPYDEKVALKSGGEDTDEVFKIRKDFGFENQYARNHFQLQNPGEEFSDIALMTNTYATDWSWSVLLQDFDNNGQSDIFITNGIVKRPNDLDYINFINTQSEKLTGGLTQEEVDEFLALMPEQKLQNRLFLQKEPLRFSSLEEAAVGAPTFSNGAAYADFDKDGDLDIIVNNINETASLMENTSRPKGNFVAFQLKSSQKGSMIHVYAAGQTWTQQYTTTRGFQASSTHFVHFGLGESPAIDSVRVVWPDHTSQLMTDIAINKYHVIEKSETAQPYHFAKAKQRGATVAKLPIEHNENVFDDYKADKLIPELLSKEGPAYVYEDFNQDGQKDLFIGGARFQAPRLYLQKGDEFVTSARNEDFERDARYEDVDAAVIDFDKDGDLDLYVVSGGNDEKELNKLLEDRLYLNDGKGNFRRIPLSLPHTNGSTVAIADFDQDGYEDIFVGARSIPASYGLVPYSFVLRNKEGLGVEIAKKERFGMLTDSQWADIDNDQDLDLVLCGDWMSIAVLENQGNGQFQYKSEELGFGQGAGLWNTIYLHDLNGDGQLDIIAGNAGENFKWKASPEQPIRLFVVDADQNGQTEPLIFAPYFSRYMPFASLDELKTQVPLVRKQFTNYEKFSTVDAIEDFEMVQDNQIVERREIQELRSMVYLSVNGTYEAYPLPAQAQWSTIQGFEMSKAGELLFVGNHDGYLTELGKSMANSGGKFARFNSATNTFEGYEALPLPRKLNTRDITAIGEGRYLVVCNNDAQYILKD